MLFRVTTIALLTLFLTACWCGSNKEAAARAKGLSQERLSRLFADVAALKPDRPDRDVVITGRNGFPREFQDLQPRYIRSTGDTALIHLAGCGDDKALLILHGLDGSTLKTIILAPGEREDPVTLWRSK